MGWGGVGWGDRGKRGQREQDNRRKKEVRDAPHFSVKHIQ